MSNMNNLYHFSLFLWHLLRNLPPISPGRLLMPSVFLCTWTLLCALQVPERDAFVWSAVLAQVAHVWGVLPVTALRLRPAFGSVKRGLRVTLAVVLCIAAAQIWHASPAFTLLLASIYCALYAAYMLRVAYGADDLMDRVIPVRKPSPDLDILRRHNIKLYAVVAILIMLTIQALVLTDAPLSTCVAVMALLPLGLHYVFHISMRLTCPPLSNG